MPSNETSIAAKHKNIHSHVRKDRQGHFTSDLLEGRGAPKAIERYFKRFGF